MALYSTPRYSTHNIELIHGYLTILIVCFAMSYALLSYRIMFSLTLSINIGLVCFWACSRSMPVLHHGRGSEEARVVILCMSMLLWARGIYWGRQQPYPSFVVPHVRMCCRSLK
jgi:hypothetical protein